MRVLEVDEQQSDLVVPGDVAHRIEHAVAVVAGKRDRPVVEHPHESDVAALVGDGRPPLMVDARKPEHVPAFDEGLVSLADLGFDRSLFEAIGEPAGIEAILKRAVVRSVYSAHDEPLLCGKPLRQESNPWRRCETTVLRRQLPRIGWSERAPVASGRIIEMTGRK